MQLIDLAAQQARIRDRIDARIAAVLDHGHYILGPEVAELEAALAEFAGVRHAITCANGTDALQLALMALGIGPGDAVVVPAFTFAATAEAVALAGAAPVFADVRAGDFNLDPDSMERAAGEAAGRGLRPAAVMPVDLFGRPADHAGIAAVAARHGLAVVADCAQSFGALCEGRASVAFGDIATTSFFPAKPLGCYGDGGAVFTADDELAEALLSLRVHGKGADKYENRRVGLNSRLDTLQAAILLEKLAVFEAEIAARERVAARYAGALAGRFGVPEAGPGRRSVWAQYTLTAADRSDRDRALAALAGAGVPSAIYYPLPLNRQLAYAGAPADPAGLPASEDLAGRVFSVPMHPYLAPDDQDRVIAALMALPGRN